MEIRKSKRIVCFLPVSWQNCRNDTNCLLNASPALEMIINGSDSVIICCIPSPGMMGSNCSVSVPANALTLEEVHARENIHPSQIQERVDSGSSGQGMAAFNKLIAAMQSKQQQQQNGNDLVSLEGRRHTTGRERERGGEEI